MARDVPIRACRHGPVRYRKSADGKEKLCVTCYGPSPTRVCPKCGASPAVRDPQGGTCLDCGFTAPWSLFLKFDLRRDG